MKNIFRVLIYPLVLLFALTVNANDKELKKASKPFDWAICPSVDGKLRVNIANTQQSNMVVLIKCGEGGVIHKNYISKKRSKAAINYDLSDLKDGDYKVYVYSGKEFEVKDFHIGEMPVRKQRNLIVGE